MAGRKSNSRGAGTKDSLTPSARAYRALIAKEKRHTKAVAAGYKGAITKLKKKARQRPLLVVDETALFVKREVEPAPVTGAEIVLFEAHGDEPRLTGFGEFASHDVRRPDWLVHVEFHREGTVVEETDVRVAMRVEQEAEGTAIRREIKAAVEVFRSEHGGEESPAVAVQRLAIVEASSGA